MSLTTHDRLLLECAENGNIEVCRVVLAAGSDLESRDILNRTPLHLAAIFDHIEICQALVESGANLEAGLQRGKVQPAGYRALHLAAIHANPEVCEFLTSVGADIEAKDVNGYTPLITITANASSGDAVDPNRLLECARQLIRHGADVNASDGGGWTPLHWLGANWDLLPNAEAFARLLLKAGANQELQTDEGYDAATISRMFGYGAMAAFLERWKLEESCGAGLDRDTEYPDQESALVL